MNPRPRVSNTITGVIRSLEKSGSIQPQEAKSLFVAFTSSFRDPWARREAWDSLVQRFGLQEVRPDRFLYYLPTARMLG